MKGRPVYQATEPRYQDKVEAVKSPLIGAQLSPSDIATRVVDLRKKKAEIEGNLSEVNLTLEAHHQLLINIYDEAGVENLKLASGHAIRTQVEPNAVVKDKEVYRRWCLANGYDELMALPWQTTNSLTKDRLQDGEPEPDGVEIFARTKVVLTSPRK
jgi:hypothetical protein|tara:strand:- start:2450 stop:2920 length:471 start_codon:yes stop_codon:yes gene_type:complete